MGVFFELSPEQIQQGITSYTPTNNRSQWNNRKKPLITRAYNANPSSMAAALKAFSSSNNAGKVVILGDMLELENTVKQNTSLSLINWKIYILKKYIW